MIKSIKLLVGKKEIELSLDEVLKLRDDLNRMHEGVYPSSVKEIHWHWPYYQQPVLKPFWAQPYEITCGDSSWGGTLTSSLVPSAYQPAITGLGGH